MKVSRATIKMLANLVIGDNELTIYKKGSQLAKFFNELGFNKEYGQKFPSRFNFTERRIYKLNKTGQIDKFLTKFFSFSNLDLYSTEEKNKILAKTNEYLNIDGYEISFKNDSFVIKKFTN